jgi:F-type H+-transporting ATPase subunit a
MLGKNLLLSQFVAPETAASLGPLGTVHVDTLLLSGLCMTVILLAGKAVASGLVVEGPGGKGQAIAEGIYNFVEDVAKGNIGHHYKTFFPLIAAIFIFVLIGNFIGVGPWLAFEDQSWWPHLLDGEKFEVASPTTDINVTAGLALVALVTYLGSGFWKHGPHFLKTLFGSPMAPIECMDMVVRPSTLALRLMVVITADELMRGSFLSMCPILLPSGIMAFELFIGCIQAFVFALLTSIYIGLTVADHH